MRRRKHLPELVPDDTICQIQSGPENDDVELFRGLVLRFSVRVPETLKPYKSCAIPPSRRGFPPDNRLEEDQPTRRTIGRKIDFLQDLSPIVILIPQRLPVEITPQIFCLVQEGVYVYRGFRAVSLSSANGSTGCWVTFPSSTLCSLDSSKPLNRSLTSFITSDPQL